MKVNMPLKRVGFTGTRQGMSKRQLDYFSQCIAMLVSHHLVEFHHGDCIGADAEAHQVILNHGGKIIIHPPASDRLRAFCYSPIILAPKDYIARNHDIVGAVDFMYAAPETDEPPSNLRGKGTWSTIKYAISKEVPINVMKR